MLPRCTKSNQTKPQQPQKRKFEEYHDPDYSKERNWMVDKQNFSKINDQNFQTEPSPTSDEHSTKYRKVCKIIEREFQREINYKIEQLEEIDNSLDKAFHLLNRLRYAIVADYYQKQTVPINASDCSTVRGSQSMFDDEPAGPQLALHPSLKKIIGKKPKTYEEILRTCPTRTAAQNAKQTILIKSQPTKKRERLLQQLIREEGIVIDHSKLPSLTPSIDPMRDLNIVTCHATTKRSNGLTTNTSDKVRTAPSLGKPLNPNRLNNKAKHLIVVGNTSKHIGADSEEQEQNTNKTLSHKWLVYVQAKDTSMPLETYVRKVRFFLHNSYRPNNIVDICSPPFQIARRGWGEFPIRIQLFFKEAFQQKPVQLIHNLILDKTLSGLQTLGAETLVEIWLRSDILEFTNSAINQQNISTSTNYGENLFTKNRKISDSQSKQIDDNLFEFLNQIEETPISLCSDIEKIQPTVIVTEPINTVPNVPCNRIEVANAAQSNSPKKSSISNVNSFTSAELLTEPNFVDKIVNAVEDHPRKPTQNGENLRINAVQDTGSASNNLKILANKKVLVLNKGELISSDIANKGKTQIVHPFVPKKVLQKKLVQLVDSNGNVKYMQMLVATSKVPLTKTTSTAPKLSASIRVNTEAEANAKTVSAPKVVTPLLVANSAVQINNKNLPSPKATKALSFPLSSSISDSKLLPRDLPKKSNSKFFTTNQSKNVVFQKEGKVYIIDPMQIKLKQHQKQQVSLLKPQLSLLKQKPQPKHQLEQQITPMICDHDYLSSTSLPVNKDDGNSKTEKNTFEKSATNYPPILKNTSFQDESLKPNLHFGIKHARFNANNALELLHKKRLDFKKDFLQKSFAGVQDAVEYLLRRIPLVATQNYEDLSAVFPFIRKSLEHFNSLPAFKQRACEWLRAKYISKTLNSHNGLYKNDNPDLLWTTKEVAIFARHHAYTPVMKSLNSNTDSRGFTDIVKNELHNERQVNFEILTSNISVHNWINTVSKNLEIQQVEVLDNQEIDVISLDINIGDGEAKCKTHKSVRTVFNANEMIYLSPPEYLEQETKLVSDICKQNNVNIEFEEITDGVVHPMSQTLLAKCLQLFVEKIIRRTLALRTNQGSSNRNLENNLIHTIEPHEIRKTIATILEFDFLSNRHLGIAQSPNEI